MCNSPYSPRASARTFSTDSSARLNNSRTSSRKSFPSAVSVTPRGLRFIKSTPISSSKSCTCRLRAGCATRSCAAALVKFNASPTARKYRRCRSSIVEFYHAGKAWQRNQRGIDAKVQEPVAALQALGGARLILATAANSKSMSPLLGGLAPRGQLIVAGAGGDEPISVAPVPLLFGLRSLAGTMTGSSIDAEDTLSFSSLQQIRPMIETVPLANAAEAYGRMMRNEARIRIVLVT